MKIYFIRHQAGGILWEYPFTAAPTAEQLAPLHALLEGRHGSAHPKTGATYWHRVVEVDALGAGEMPATTPPVLEGSDAARGSGSGTFADLVASGSGRVRNP